VVVHHKLVEVLVLEEDLLVVIYILLGLLETLDLLKDKVPDLLGGLVERED